MKNRIYICDKNMLIYLDEIIKKAEIARNRFFSIICAFASRLSCRFYFAIKAFNSTLVAVVYLGYFLAVFLSV